MEPVLSQVKSGSFVVLTVDTLFHSFVYVCTG